MEQNTLLPECRLTKLPERIGCPEQFAHGSLIFNTPWKLSIIATELQIYWNIERFLSVPAGKVDNEGIIGTCSVESAGKLEVISEFQSCVVKL